MQYFAKRIVVSFFSALFGLGLLAVPAALVQASTSVSLQSLSPSTNVSVGTAVSFVVSASGFTDPTYRVSDSFSGTSVSNDNINSSGDFSWTPDSGDVGTHALTVTVSDPSGDSATAVETLVVSAAPSVSIESLSPGSSLVIGQAFSFSVAQSGFSNPTYSVSDTFNGSTVVNSDINSSGNFSWTPEAQDVGAHTLTVTVRDSSGRSASATEEISVSAVPTLTITSLSPSANMNVGQTLTFHASAANFSNPSYTVSDSFGNSTVQSGDINSAGNFSWTPSAQDAGVHTLTVTARDSSGHAATASQTITVGGSGASIESLSPGDTVVEGNTVSFTVGSSGFTNPVYSVSDSFSGTTVSNANINTAGYFSWTPDESQAGDHDITVYVNDSEGHSGMASLALTVEGPTLTITSISPSTLVRPNAPLSFTVSQMGFSNPTYTLSDSFQGSSITDADINAAGNFSWTPTSDQLGAHTIAVYATDSQGHSANTSIAIDVNSGASLSLTAPAPNAAVTAGTPVSFQAYADGFTLPVYSVQDSFSGSSITSNDIDSSGSFNWTPSAQDVGTHTLTVTATDAFGHTAQEQVAITVASSGETAPATADTSSSSSFHSSLSQSQAQSILSLLTSFGATQSVIDNVSLVLGVSNGDASNDSSASAGAPRFVFDSYLYPGLQSNDVTELQETLANLGFFTDQATGYYGDETENAVIAFQAANGIDQLGVVGPSTRAALNALPASDIGASDDASSTQTGTDGYTFTTLISPGDQDDAVTELQERLAALGYYSGPVTGYFGDETQAAVESLQAANNIEVVGWVGPATRAVLNQ